MAVVGERRRAAGTVWALLALALWLVGTPPARAQVRPAREPIVNRRLQRVVEMIPGSATDLPPYLAKSQDVYLLVTAGASYTDVQVLANPEVPPPSVARALASALAGTPLRGRTVEWSADRYSAAQVSVHQNRFGSLRGSNVVPLGPLMSGLRQAGLTPHLLLRTPRYARDSVPSPRYGTKTFRWYDARRLGSRGSVTVTAALTPLSLALPLCYFLAVPLIGFLGLSLAGFLSGRGRRDDAARRLVFRTVNSYALMAAVLAQFAGLFALLHAPVLSALADLWLGSSTTTTLVPLLTLTVIPLVIFLSLGRKQEIRRFGPVAAGPAIPMPDDEKAARKRVAQFSLVPHLMGAVSLGILPFFVPRTSPLYPFIHPVAMLLPALGGGLAAAIFQKQLGRFTRKTKDDDLTWRARQLGLTLGVRMPDVFVEDSSRAAHLAFASHQGHHITLSRKLQETFTPAETDFVLAHHLACMKRRGGGDRKWVRTLMTLPMLVPVVLILSPRLIPGIPTMNALILSPWFFPAVTLYFGGLLTLMFLLGGNAQRQAKQEMEADRDALEATGDTAAAESALDKIDLSPAMVSLHTGGNMNSEVARRMETLQTARLASRRVALQQAAKLPRISSPNTDSQRSR